MNEAQRKKILESLVQEFRRGSLVLAVLSQLGEYQYGYQLSAAMGEKGMEADQNTLYPLLRRLEKQGILESRWQLEEGRQRRYYRLSPEGRVLLKELKEAWEETARVMETLLKAGEKNA